MPSNLNALIRYKTINSCLYGGRKRWSIVELTEACSSALAETRGRYESVSERTIRDDIRVMRSDILGFNAPIKQKSGLYFYSSPHYSILSIGVTDQKLIENVISLLEELKSMVSHHGLELLLGKLKGLETGLSEINMIEETFTPEVRAGKAYPDDIQHEMPLGEFSSQKHEKLLSKRKINANLAENMNFALTPGSSVLWGDVMDLLTSKRRS